MLGLGLLAFAIYFYFIPSKRYISVVLLFAIMTAGFQMLPLKMVVLEPGIKKPYDFMFIFFAVVFVLKPGLFFNRFVYSYNKTVFIFMGALLALFAYSIMNLKVEPVIAIRVLRSYLFFAFLFLFIPLERDDYKKVFRIITYFTAAGALIYCFQPAVGSQILNGLINVNAVEMEASGIHRYFNYPVFLFPVIFLLFLDKEELGIRFRNWLAVIVVAAIMITQFRNFLLALIVCFLLYMYLSGKLKPATIVLSVLLGFAVFFVADSALNNRFSKGITEIAKGKFSTKKSAVYSITPADLHLLSTSEYRWYHFMERFHYIESDPSKLLLGIGLINEDSRLIRKLAFIVGTTNDENNSNVPQVDTGDITWSLLILQIGLIGIGFFLLAYTGIISTFISLLKDNIMKVGLLFVICLFISSFYMIDILQSYNICFISLFLAYAYHLRRAKENREEPAIA